MIFLIILELQKKLENLEHSFEEIYMNIPKIIPTNTHYKYDEIYSS